MQSWTMADIPPQAGRLAVVTGATGGPGYETALALAQAGADVIVAGSDEAQGREALSKIRPRARGALVRFERLDLGSLASVADFAGRLGNAGRPVDVLINNAGVLALRQRQATADGFEMQLGINYLGHFALTARLLPLLQRSRQPRVVHLSSLSQQRGSIHFEDLQLERSYTPWMANEQSNLASLIFALELQRRSDARGWGLLSVAAHPGNARTEQIAQGPGLASLLYRARWGFRFMLGQAAAGGAVPTLYAATAPKASPGGYYGPHGAFEPAGPPGLAWIADKANDLATARKLWAVSERLTGVKWHPE